DGLRVNTTLDPELQRAAHNAVHKHLAVMQPKLDAELRQRKVRAGWEKEHATTAGRWSDVTKQPREIYDHKSKRVDPLSYRDSLWHYHKMLNGAVFIMDPSNGAVRAWVGGNDHRFLPYDLVQAKRSIASTIKPVIYAAAIEGGMDPCTYLDNEKRTYGEFEDWAPDNFDRDTVGGEVAMWYALARSMNRPTVDLYFRTGVDTISNMFKALGLPVKNLDKPAVALGASDISLFEIVPAYGAFAKQGKRIAPQLITSITDAKGTVLYKAKPLKPRQVIAERTAMEVTAMLQKAIDEGTGVALRNRYGIASSIAGKTGTSQNYSDAWFVAYTPGIVIGTWVGAFDPEIHFNSTNGTGTQLALPIAGMVLKEIETKSALRKRYFLPFSRSDEIEIDLDCEPRRFPNALERLMQDVFGRNKRTDIDSAGDPIKKENMFDRLFKKKK
nr:penicillin-binding transpeptidase domain-containing protein [Bacteroidota bacterium]